MLHFSILASEFVFNPETKEVRKILDTLSSEVINTPLKHLDEIVLVMPHVNNIDSTSLADIYVFFLPDDSQNQVYLQLKDSFCPDSNFPNYVVKTKLGIPVKRKFFN